MRTRSGYSFRTAYGFLEDVIARVESDYAPLTDRASAYGFNRWRKLCQKAGKRPVFGIELAVTDSPNAKKMNLNHVTLVATSSLAPVNAALELAFSKFRYEPLLTYQDLNALDKSVAVILGRRINPEQLDKSRTWYMAEGPGQIPAMKRWAKELGWLPVASSDNAYPAPEDRHAYAIAMGRDANTQTWAQHILSNAELSMYASPEAFANREALAAMCTADMLEPKLVKPATDKTVEE